MQVFPSKQYKKSLKRVLKSGKVKIKEIDTVVDFLLSEGILPAKYRDRSLTGEYIGYRECHIKPDLLLIYKKDKNILFLILKDIGSHSEIF